MDYMYPYQVLFKSMTLNNDSFRTVICHTQNLSLLKFYYLGIKIIILPFSYFKKRNIKKFIKKN